MSIYVHCLIAQPVCVRAAFKGDSQATQAALVEIRKHFRDNATASESAIPKLVADGHEALSFLRDAVLQGQLNERGNYGAYRVGYAYLRSQGTLMSALVDVEVQSWSFSVLNSLQTSWY